MRLSRSRPGRSQGGKDGGKDATAIKDGEPRIMAVYFPRGQKTFREIKAKFLGDFKGVAANGARGIAFVTNQELTSAERTELADAVDGSVDIFHLERVAHVLDRPDMHPLRAQFVGIEGERSTGRPRLAFSDLRFARPGEHPRVLYPFAIGVEVTNAGDGTAHRVNWGCMRPDVDIYAEMVVRSAIAPGERTDDWSGIRGAERDDDVTEEEAHEFFRECLVFATCWDAAGVPYIFFPFGGGPMPGAPLFGDEMELREFLSRFPSRGDDERSLGAGGAWIDSLDRVDDEKAPDVADGGATNPETPAHEPE